MAPPALPKRRQYPNRERELRLRDFSLRVLGRRRLEVLNLTQNQIARQVGLHQSRISRIEQGESPRDYRTARIIAEVYGLSEAEEEEWYGLLFGLPPQLGSPTDQPLLPMHVLVDYPAFIHEVRIRGDPQLAARIARKLNDDLKIHSFTSAYSDDLLRIRAEALYEQATAFTEFLPRSGILREMQPIFEELVAIARLRSDEQTYALACLGLGDAFYIANRDRKAIEALEGAIPILQGDDLLRLLRILGLNWARLGHRAEFEAVEALSLSHLEQGHFSTLEHVSLAYEGLARAHGLLRSQKATRFLDQGWQVYRQLERDDLRAPIRAVQLATTQMELTAILEPSNARLIEAQGAQWHEIAKQLRLTRHVGRMMKVLKASLD